MYRFQGWPRSLKEWIRLHILRKIRIATAHSHPSERVRGVVVASGDEESVRYVPVGIRLIKDKEPFGPSNGFGMA